jgi:hypothetical protein
MHRREFQFDTGDEMIVKLKTVADYEDVKLIWAQVIVEE